MQKTDHSGISRFAAVTTQPGNISELDDSGKSVSCINRLVHFMLLRINQSSGIPLYQQLMEQVKHAVETGALRAGDQLPTIRKLSEDLVMNPNTVARAYRELEHEGIIELRHGSGAFISSLAGWKGAWKSGLTKKAQAIVQAAVEKLVAQGLSAEEIRRLVESELAQVADGKSLAGSEHE